MVLNSTPTLRIDPCQRSARAWAGKLIERALDALYPPRCGGCHKWGAGIWCKKCDQAVLRLTGEAAVQELITEKQRAIIVVSAARFGGSLREGIHALKYDGVPHMAQPFARIMAQMMPRVLAQVGDAASIALVPVPLHARKLRERGYNQSEMLARALATPAHARVIANALRRTRSTQQQARLSADERKQNVLGAFVGQPESMRGMSIILIDDVLTTGATLAGCADALFDAGATDVVALTLARADL